MVEESLIARSGLEQVVVIGLHGEQASSPDVLIQPRGMMSLAHIISRKGRIADGSNYAAKAFGLALPMTPRRVEAGNIGFVWAGPGQWLAMTEQIAGHVFESQLRRDFAGLASVINQSDSRSVIRIGGTKARDALAKGIPLDLDPRVFATGDTALTMAGHINVHLWQIDDAPTYEFAVFRSFAAAFYTWLLEASAEFGVAVTAASQGLHSARFASS
jgi:methylglutamate dehydrogenase subunit D